MALWYRENGEINIAVDKFFVKMLENKLKKYLYVTHRSGDLVKYDVSDINNTKVEWHIDNLYPEYSYFTNDVDLDGNIYIGLSGWDENRVVSYTPEGNYRWTTLLGNDNRPWSIVADLYGYVYSGQYYYYPTIQGQVTKIRTSDGHIMWRRNINERAIGIDTDFYGNVYTCTVNGDRIYKISPSNNVLWSRYRGNISGGLGIDTEGNSYFTANQRLYKYDTNGNYVWNRSATHLYGNTFVDSFNYIHTAYGNYYYKYNTNGSKIHTKYGYYETHYGTCDIDGGFYTINNHDYTLAYIDFYNNETRFSPPKPSGVSYIDSVFMWPGKAGLKVANKYYNEVK